MAKTTEEQIITLVKLQKIDSEVQKLELSLQKMPVQIGILEERLEEFLRGVGATSNDQPKKTATFNPFADLKDKLDDSKR